MLDVFKLHICRLERLSRLALPPASCSSPDITPTTEQSTKVRSNPGQYHATWARNFTSLLLIQIRHTCFFARASLCTWLSRELVTTCSIVTETRTTSHQAIGAKTPRRQCEAWHTAEARCLFSHQSPPPGRSLSTMVGAHNQGTTCPQ